MQRRPRGLSAYYVNEEERLQEILVDKSVLKLPLVSKDNWIKNEQRPHCYYCQRKFRPFVRKHHCRACGEIVCRHCNRHRKVQVGASLEQTINVRLCFDCIDKAMIDAGKTESHHAAGSEHDNETTPDCNFLNKSLNASSSAVTTSSTASGASSSARITDSMASLEISRVESNASGYEYDSSSEAESEGELRDTTHKSLRGSTQHLQQISRTYSNHIEFLPEEAQHEIYEIRRQELLELYGIMDSGCQTTEHDALCELASRALECNVAAVGFIDGTRQWYKARRGISQRELPRNIAFCSQLLQSSLPTIIMDASLDPRFSSNPLVTGSASIRFYATTPICDPASGVVIGSVFVMDPKPKKVLPPRAMEILAYLSTAAEKLLLNAKRVDQKQQQSQHQQRASEITRRKSATIKRSQRVNSAPSIPSSEDFAQQRTDIRAASLQCVPEEFETKENNDFSASTGISHALPRDKRERELYELIDPDLLLPHSLPRRSSESKLTPRPSNKFTRSSSFTERSSSFSFRSMTSSIFEEDEPEEEEEAATAGKEPPPPPQKLNSPSDVTCANQQPAPPMSGSGEMSGGVAFDLICRITSTQQLLAQQQSAFLETLTQHSSRIGSMEKTMGRIEEVMETLVRNSSGNSRQQQAYEVDI